MVSDMVEDLVLVGMEVKLGAGRLEWRSWSELDGMGMGMLVHWVHLLV